jgi:hypothetical protein
VEASFSRRRDVVGLGQSKTKGGTFREKVVVRLCVGTNHGILAGTDAELDTMNTENHSEMKKDAEEWEMHRKPMVHDFLEMWQGSQNLHATQKEFRAQTNT